MKKKLLSLLLVITLLAVTVSVALPTTLASADNLFTNGDFASSTGSTPTGWKLNLVDSAGASAEIVKNEQIAQGVTKNALKITTTKDTTDQSAFLYGGKIKIEKNATYTTTYWIKVKNIKGLRTYMFEPDYIDAATGNEKKNQGAVEGRNIYTYSWEGNDSFKTRVCRTDIKHSWKVAETGNEIGDANGVSMFIVRSGASTLKVLTPDFPETTREGEWLQVVHTFETGNLAAHEAEVSYQLSIPAAVDGEVWLADFKMNVVKSAVLDYYTPTVNDNTLGTVSKDVPLMQGITSEITAEPFGENTFDGWYDGDDCVSTSPTLSFTYDSANPIPVYQARFTKADWGIDGSFETGYTNGQTVAKRADVTYNNPDTAGNWTGDLFKSTSKDGNNKFFIDSEYHNYGSASITTDQAHTGRFSLKMDTNSRFVGYKISGLNKNTDYNVSFYAKTMRSSQDGSTINWVMITDANMSCMVKGSDNKIVNRTVEAGALAKENVSATNFRDTWAKVELEFNSKDSTEIIVWVRPERASTQLYLDNFAVKRLPKAFNANVNNADLGKASSETTNVLVGTEVTVVAESINDGKFVGWYIGDELMSQNLEYTFTYEDRFSGLIAVFEPGVNSIANPGLEGYESGKLLAQLVHTVDINKAGTEWTDKLFLSTSKDGEGIYYVESNNAGTYRQATVTSAYSHSGGKSIEFNGLYGFMGRKFTGLQTNTDYTISYYGMVKGAADATFGGAIVSKADATIYNANASLKNTENPDILARSDKAYNSVDQWTKDSIRFNSGDNTEVILWIYHDKLGKVYLDDFSLRYSPTEFKPVSNNSGLGSVTPTEYIECDEGDSITVTATSYPDATFTGWYVGDVLISKDAEFTFEYADRYQGLTAVFAGAPGTIPNGGFEYYQNGQVLANFNNNKYTNNAPWSIDTQYRSDNATLSVVNNIVHTGEKAAKLDIPYRHAGLDINGLTPNTQYLVSFWAYITGEEPRPGTNDDQNGKNLSNAIVTKTKHTVYVKNEKTDKWETDLKDQLGELGGPVDCYNKWKKIDVLFTTPEDSGDVTLWLTFSGYQARLYIDDFIIGVGIEGTISADLGGTTSANIDSKYVLKGTEITATATPFEGNTFVGWYTPKGNLVSKQAVYTFTANESFAFIAKFDGYNKPATDLFAIGGNDGTFENGNVSSWSFNDNQYSTDWCSASVSSTFAYEGKNSLSVNGRFRNSVLAIKGLSPNSDYRLSFYVNLPNLDGSAKIENMAIVPEGAKSAADANQIFAQTGLIYANSGWNRIDLYFNSGANVNLGLAIRFAAELGGPSGYDKLYIDNLSLYNYDASKEVLNSSFDEGKTYWIGDGAVVSEAGNNVLSLGANETVYQDIKVDTYSLYNVTFKAKGGLTAAAQDLSKFNINVKNFISSKSYIDANGTEWKEYTYNVYTGVQQAMNFVFKAGENGAMIDDLKITKSIESVGAILEHIDFETDRFVLSTESNDNGFSIYTAQGENDPNVASGNRSLKFTYQEITATMEKILSDAWLSYQPGIGNSFKISLKLKIVGGGTGGAVSAMPEYSGTYGVDTGFEHMAKDDKWQTINFFVNNSTYGVFKAKIAAIANNTASDFYVDDIIISVTPPMVLEENSKATYCERLYNAVENESFENPTTDKDWGTLPSTAQIVKGDALKGSHFLRANAGTHYVIPVSVKGGKEYYFAASVRGTAATVGSIGVALDAQGTTYYANRDDKPASIVKFDSSEKGWKRNGFKITTNNSGIAYIVIDVTAGALDIDSVMMFTAEFAYRFDPNDYTVYVPYDFDNLQSSTTVINGGFGKQPYYGVTTEGKEGA